MGVDGSKPSPLSVFLIGQRHPVDETLLFDEFFEIVSGKSLAWGVENFLLFEKSFCADLIP